MQQKRMDGEQSSVSSRRAFAADCWLQQSASCGPKQAGKALVMQCEGPQPRQLCRQPAIMSLGVAPGRTCTCLTSRVPHLPTAMFLSVAGMISSKLRLAAGAAAGAAGVTPAAAGTAGVAAVVAAAPLVTAGGTVAAAGVATAGVAATAAGVSGAGEGVAGAPTALATAAAAAGAAAVAAAADRPATLGPAPMVCSCARVVRHSPMSWCLPLLW